MPPWFDSGAQDPETILASAGWQQSMPWCRGLFVLSEALRRWLAPRVPVPVCALQHPTAEPAMRFSLEAYRENAAPALLHIGWWLRRFSSFYALPVTRLDKIMLEVPLASVRAILRHELGLVAARDRRGTVQFRSYLSPDAYDLLLSRNIVFLDPYAISASNTVVECMVRHTPIVARRLDAVVEYLGPHYPLYFDDLDEAAKKAEDAQLIADAHAYLQRWPLTRQLTQAEFLRSFLASEIGSRLAL